MPRCALCNDLKNQLLEGRGKVINHFYGRRSEIEKCLGGRLWGNIFPLPLGRVRCIKYKAKLFKCLCREAVT